MESTKNDLPIYSFTVHEDDRATLVCPACEFERKVDTSKLKDPNATVRIKCRCGEVFGAQFEFEKTGRKKVRLHGDYVNLRSEEEGEVLIDALSMSGMGFATLGSNNIKVHDTLLVTFYLDNDEQTRIRKKVLVSAAEDQFISCKFANDERDPDLGFYLMM